MRTPTAPPTRPLPLAQLDLFDPELFRSGSPHHAWHTLRHQAPVWPQFGPGGIRFWSLTRYQDVLAVVKDHRRFSSEHGTILAVLGGDSAGGKTINLMDPPKHAAIRVPTMRLLSARPMGRRAERIRADVRQLIAPLAEGGECDFAELMLRLPLIAVGDVIGIPRSEWRDIPRWTMAGVAPADPTFARGSVEETLRDAHHALLALFHDLIRERRERPADDVISMLLRARWQGRPLRPDEVLLNCYSFIMGANTTTPHVANHLVHALAERPEQWQRLRRDPGGATAAVEEALRWSTPTNHLLRRVTSDVTIGGTDIAAGETVCAWIASANRDEAVFDEPYEFRPTRSPNPHLAFGSGIHFCNGAPGARLVLPVLLEELLGTVTDLALAGPVTHLYSNFINGITSLPVATQPVHRKAAAVAAAHP